MIARLLYASSAAIFIAGIVYGVARKPRPCRMDDVLTACGSGARYGALIGAAFIALLLLYVGRALRSNERQR
ncbi:MAG: hypothetical protein M3198_14360 [Actinomycetota bacterium]|nr:hypothetical protein [Actinomycetota bacterium]